MCGKWRNVVAVIGLLLVFLLMPTAVYAHDVNVVYSSDIEIEITAEYDSGEPMAGAQVIVYAPDDATTPWLKGECDDEGRFSFTPDTTKPGIWDVTVRLAGHGDIIHIPVGETTATTEDNSSFSVLQIVLMSACVIWGSIGTALYFSKRRNA